MTDAHCAHCDPHEHRIVELESLVSYIGKTLRFVAIATPIILGTASFVILVVRG